MGRRIKNMSVETHGETYFTLYQRILRYRLRPSKNQMMQFGYDVKSLHSDNYSEVDYGFGKEAQELTDQREMRFFEVRWYSKEDKEFLKEVDKLAKAIDCPKKKRERKTTYISQSGEKVLK